MDAYFYMIYNGLSFINDFCIEQDAYLTGLSSDP